MNSLEWFVPFIAATPSHTALTYDKDRSNSQYFSDKIMKIHCDLSRICEVEDSVVEWYNSEYFQRADSLDLHQLEHLKEFFEI